MFVIIYLSGFNFLVVARFFQRIGPRPLFTRKVDFREIDKASDESSHDVMEGTKNGRFSRHFGFGEADDCQKYCGVCESFVRKNGKFFCIGQPTTFLIGYFFSYSDKPWENFRLFGKKLETI